MDTDINIFVQIRDYLLDNLEEKAKVYLAGMWDPLCKYILIRETYEIINRELSDAFPDFPKEYFPKVKFKINDEEFSIEATVQTFLNTDTDLIFLANLDVSSQNYDLYCRKSWDPRFDYVFFARFGHSIDSVIKGSKTAVAEYFTGKHTPLSLAYHMALQEGFVS